MKLFVCYLKEKIRTLAMLSLFAVICVCCTLLCRLPLKAILYPAFLCVLSGTVFLVSGFLRYRKKHEQLQNAASPDCLELPLLHDGATLIEKDYEKIIELLKEENKLLEQKALEKYEGMMDYYTVWAHQIKTPIASMKLTLQGLDSAESRRLSGELFRIEQYVEMVLAFLRLDSATTDFLFAGYELDTVIRKSVKRLAPDFISKKLRLELEETGKKLVTDEKWLSFVIEQILSNSLKYTKEGYVKIYMKGENLLCIEDSGIGISQSDIPRIFENGFTGKNGRMENSSSGIGLYLCKRICDKLGIGLSVSSAVGKGTAVTLDFGTSGNNLS